MKRAFDIAGAAGLLVGLAPLLLVVAILVRLKLGAPVLFSQQRPGLLGKPFRMYKFRSMTDARDASGRLQPDAARLTRFGKLLRATSLDELPELWNILKGDMSFVGPRPLLMDYMPRYSPKQARRHLVRPGLTGLAQVSGRNSLGWSSKFELDVWYVDNRSFLLDLKIIARTVSAVLRRREVSAEGEATMTPFVGDEPRISE